MKCRICQSETDVPRSIYCSPNCRSEGIRRRGRTRNTKRSQALIDAERRIVELEELNDAFKLEIRMLRKYGNNLLADIHVAKEQSVHGN